MIKPKRLTRGAKIAVISPSAGLPYVYPHIYELGLRHLECVFGFEIMEMPSARMSPDELYYNPSVRAKDINDCFADESIDGIITSIGGDESVRILPYLDMETIIDHPTFIMGFSDATTFLSYLNVCGLVTFYGPAVMAGFAQTKHLPHAFTEHVDGFLFDDHFPYVYRPYEKWTNGYKEWRNLDTLGECTPFYTNETGWTFLQGESRVNGYLWGGCIEVLEFMKATPYWPLIDFWHDKILFFETSEEKPSPEDVGRMLRNYGMQGVFKEIRGILFGRPKDYTATEKEELNKTIVRIVRDEFQAADIPIVVDVDFGHTDPSFILPLGGHIQVDPSSNQIVLLESPFL